MAYPHDQYAHYQPQPQYPMTQVQSSPSHPVYTPLDASMYNSQQSPAGGGGGQYPSSRPSSYIQQNNSGIHLASPPSTNSNPSTGSAADPRSSMFKAPFPSPGFSDPGLSPSSAVPLLYHNAGHPSSISPYSPPLSSPSAGGGGGGAPPAFTTSLSSPSIQKTLSAGPLSPGKSSRIARRRLSSFKHTDYDYKNDPVIRHAYLSRTSHFLSIWLPFAGFVVILGGLWGLTIATQLQKPGHTLEINSEGFYNFAINEPTLQVAAFTFISSIMNAILLWCFGCAVLSYARYRLSLGRPISLKGLSALSSAKMGEFAMFSHPLGSKWGWLCLICWGAFLATTTGFNTILLPTRRPVEQKITATELDMTSPSFASFYNANTGTGGRYYDCYRWLPVRGIAVSPCPAGTSFTATTYAGRSHFESRELGELTYIRLGQITYTGTTWGTLPFTSFNNQNSFDTNLKRYPAPNQNFTIALTNQGLRANISCQDVPSSPLSMATTLPAGSSPLPCNPDTPIATISPDLRMRAGYCNSSTPVTVGSTSFPSYDFYMRFTGDYIHFEPNGEPHNENITCRITPFVTVENSAFMSTDNSTWVERNRKIQATGMYPQALVERILGTLVDMMTVFGQNSIDNLIAEQFVQITTSYFNGTYTSWPLVAQRQLEGMFAFLASYERILAESQTQGNPAFARLIQTGTLKHDTFAYSVEWPTYLLLIPITIVCLLGMWFLIKSASFRHVPRFDPLNSTSLITAAAATSHSLFMDEAAVKGAAPDDDTANDAHIAFVRDDQTGQWGLERVPC